MRGVSSEEDVANAVAGGTSDEARLANLAAIAANPEGAVAKKIGARLLRKKLRQKQHLELQRQTTRAANRDKAVLHAQKRAVHNAEVKALKFSPIQAWQARQDNGHTAPSRRLRPAEKRMKQETGQWVPAAPKEIVGSTAEELVDFPSFFGAPIKEALNVSVLFAISFHDADLNLSSILKAAK
jgi:hypothetical protein